MGLLRMDLTDVYKDYAMGSAAELCARECNISREAQDEFAIESYNRSQTAVNEGKFKEEIVGVEISSTKRRPNSIFKRRRTI
ncbi:MAG: hypothetical protein WKF59_20920 [Chitinophagaceae bacterium]